MSIADYIRAMPKVELNARLEGTYRKPALMAIADENEIANQVKHFNDVAAQWDDPDFSKLDTFVANYMEWLRFPDDLTRLIYDAGVSLSRHNIKYVEMSVNPVLHMLSGMSFDDFLTALNDGRDRVERGWGIKINWVLSVSRSAPRSADDTLRWAASASGRKKGVVAFGLSGSEQSQPAGQFERAFHTATKKEVISVAQAGDVDGAEGVKSVIALAPSRVVDGWGVADDEDLITLFANEQIPLLVDLGRAKSMGWIEEIADYPLRKLYDENVRLILSAEMPSIYGMTLDDEYVAAVDLCGLTIEELEEIALNAVYASALTEEEKEEMVAEFKAEYVRLREEHLTSSEPN